MLRTMSLLVATSVLFSRGAFALPVMLSLEPAVTSDVDAGDLVQLTLWARSIPPGQGVLAVQAFIQFDPALLRVVDSSGNPVNAIVPDPNWNLVLANRVGPDPPTQLLAGEIFFSAGNFPGFGRLTDFEVAKMTFEALSDFAATTVQLPAGFIDRGPYRYGSKVTDLGNQTVTGELHGAELRGSETVIPEPLSLVVLGSGVGLLRLRRRDSRRGVRGKGYAAGKPVSGRLGSVVTNVLGEAPR